MSQYNWPRFEKQSSVSWLFAISRCDTKSSSLTDSAALRHQPGMRRCKGNAADADAVAAGEFGPLHAAVVEERAVGTLQVAHQEGLAHPADLGVPPRHLVVLELDEIARIATDAQRPFVVREIVTGAAIAALDDVKRRHGRSTPGTPRRLRFVPTRFSHRRRRR